MPSRMVSMKMREQFWSANLRGKRPHGIRSDRREDNIKNNTGHTVYEDVG
jgi:hypothetical protein